MITGQEANTLSHKSLKKEKRVAQKIVDLEIQKISSALKDVARKGEFFFEYTIEYDSDTPPKQTRALIWVLKKEIAALGYKYVILDEPYSLFPAITVRLDWSSTTLFSKS